MIAGAVGERWQSLRAAKPGIRARDAAAELGVSEAELVASTLGDTAVRLQDDPGDLLHALVAVGRCMALTRNEHCVSEVRGRYGGVELGAHAGQVIGEHIDLRVFLAHWTYLFAIDEAHPHEAGARRRSIHVFDACGTAVHKIYLESADAAEVATWDAIVAARTVVSAPPLAIAAPPAKRPDKPDAAVDREVFLADWDAMQDTHEFFHLLGKHGVARTQALRIAGTARARRVRVDAIDTLLRAAAETRSSIMIFVGSRGCIQVFSGTVDNVVVHGPWLNVMDPGFNLHLRADRIAASWVVAKPTRSGIVSSLELYDAAGEVIAMVFRKRDDRARAEDPAWSAMLGRLAGAEAS